ncbi:MAG: 2,3-diketo-5-methylthiopentyl-1-phosphate enolase [Alicyclobacillus sp.]|nr:2,3-diketo-5-methylthiopentyl-1-phosphate enolase [Alicyclobacillus sp.]
MTGHVVATYRVVDSAASLGKRAEGIAVGLTVGSWTDLPAARQDAVRAYAGRVESIQVLEDAGPGRVVADISIGYPAATFTGTFASLLTIVFGKLSMDGEIRLVDLSLPDRFASGFPGPKFGAVGVRQRTGVADRPLLMSIFKACVGRDVADLTAHFRAQAAGGADLIKDDEIFFNEDCAPPEARVPAFAEAARQVYEETGHRAHYAVNLTGPVYGLRERAKRLAELGADALLFNAIPYGLDVLRELAEDPDIQVPLLIHPATSGAIYAAPHHGMAANILLGELLRLAGGDIAIYPSPYGTVTLDRAEGLRLVDALRRPGPHRAVLPAPSAGIFPGLVPRLVEDLGVDCVVNAGGAIHGHPGGATAGAAAFRSAIAAVVAGQDLADAAQASEPLAVALEKWGRGV